MIPLRDAELRNVLPLSSHTIFRNFDRLELACKHHVSSEWAITHTSIRSLLQDGGTESCYRTTLHFETIQWSHAGEWTLLIRSPEGIADASVLLNVTLASGYSRGHIRSASPVYLLLCLILHAILKHRRWGRLGAEIQAWETSAELSGRCSENGFSSFFRKRRAKGKRPPFVHNAEGFLFPRATTKRACARGAYLCVSVALCEHDETRRESRRGAPSNHHGLGVPRISQRVLLESRITRVRDFEGCHDRRCAKLEEASSRGHAIKIRFLWPYIEGIGNERRRDRAQIRIYIWRKFVNYEFPRHAPCIYLYRYNRW